MKDEIETSEFNANCEMIQMTLSIIQKCCFNEYWIMFQYNSHNYNYVFHINTISDSMKLEWISIALVIHIFTISIYLLSG